MVMKVAGAKTARPAAEKAARAEKPAAAKKAAAKPAKTAAAAVRKKAARTPLGRDASADGMMVKFDNTLQRVRDRNKELTADLNALLAGLKSPSQF